MAISAVKDIAQGTMISFRSKRADDTVAWRGILEMPIGTYRSVRGYGDQRPYNEAVRRVDPSVTSDITDLTYFLITLDNSAENDATYVFAQEWIEEGSLVAITPGNKVTIQVDDVTSDPQSILSLLASAGYSCKIIP